ncbi:MAG: RNA 2',3'-cyclic phosphodiesterase [candidate division Zixibacteria bacterium]|nr:RNA 2',3'-cyclic phosphodiesterase [candidate division Zixibacteria bacterium]
MYRLFVAIDLPEDIKDRLLSLYYGLPGAKWADESQMHITLRFLGEVDGAAFRDARESLGTVRVPPFWLTVKGVGFFPPRKQPDTLWAGLERSESLLRLRHRVESTLTRAGFPVDSRKYVPHIGLARLKGTPADRVAGFLAEHALLQLEPFQVTEFVLYSSFLSSERALHEVEATYPLIGNSSGDV